MLARLANNFSAETKQRDDDTHMLAYIEKEMERRQPKTPDDVQSDSS